VIIGLRFGFHKSDRTASMGRAQCHIHDTSHQIEWLVELKALLGGLDSTGAWVVVDSSLVAAVADSNPVAAVVAGSNPVAVVADSNPVAVAVVVIVVEAVVVAVVVAVEVLAVVEQVESTAFGLEPQGEEGPLLYQQQVKT
jgi:hypothetical protein